MPDQQSESPPETKKPSVQESSSQEGTPKAIPFKIQEKITVSAEKVNTTAEDEYILEGNVDIVSGESRIQASKVYLNNRTKDCLAEGSVLLDWGENHLAGESLEYNLDTEKGAIYSVLGYIEPEYIFTAQRVEKVAEDVVILHKGIFTSCTQPTPYWSFRVEKARIHLNHYAHLRNVLFRVEKVPVIYLPYLVWPVKRDRAAGLLFPEFGSTKERGNIISEAFFWPIRRNMDATFYADYYSLAGLGGGIEYNFIPNERGIGRFLGYYINDKVTGKRRYEFNYSQEQNFGKDFRMTANLSEISDFNYYADFERDIKYSSQSYILSRATMSRNWSYYSFNAVAERRQQLLALGEIVQSMLPELELRGRSRKISTSPFYFTFESSFNNFSKRSTKDVLGVEFTDYDASYLRYDILPTFSMPYSPFPWLDLNPTIQFRDTFYSKRIEISDPLEVADKSLNRFLYGGTLEVIGPKFYKVYERPKSTFSQVYKHSIEPRIVYFYAPVYDRQSEIPRFDQIDFVQAGNLATFYLRNALLAKKPLKTETKAPEGEGKEKVEPKEGEEKEKIAAETQSLNPVEIASLEISQSYSFDLPLSSGKGETKQYSPIAATMRFYPTNNYSVDLRATYDVIYNALRSASISSSLRKEEIGYLSFVLLAQNGFEGAPNNEQLSFEGGTYLFSQRLGLNAKLSYNFSQSFLPEQRYRIEYYTQCCGFYFEYLDRDFTTNQRREFRFAIDLKGIGKVIDFHQGFNR